MGGGCRKGGTGSETTVATEVSFCNAANTKIWVVVQFEEERRQGWQGDCLIGVGGTRAPLSCDAVPRILSGMHTDNELDWTDKQLAKLKREQPANQTPEQIAVRAKLWQEFVARYQAELVTSPEKFSEYCEKFRERWVAGK